MISRRGDRRLLWRPRAPSEPPGTPIIAFVGQGNALKLLALMLNALCGPRVVSSWCGCVTACGRCPFKVQWRPTKQRSLIWMACWLTFRAPTAPPSSR
jgi:hypothetical protein